MASSATPGASERFVASAEQFDTGTSVSVLEILRITHFDELFETYPSLAAAAERNGNSHL